MCECYPPNYNFFSPRVTVNSESPRFAKIVLRFYCVFLFSLSSAWCEQVISGGM